MNKRTTFHSYKPEESLDKDNKEIVRNKTDFKYFDDLMKSSPNVYKKPKDYDYEGGSSTGEDGFSWDYYHNDDYDGNDYEDY